MAALDVNTHTTLDGVVPAPGEPDGDLDETFQDGGSQVPRLHPGSGQVITDHSGRLVPQGSGRTSLPRAEAVAHLDPILTSGVVLTDRPEAAT